MNDLRQVIRSDSNLFTQFPYSAVAAVDSIYSYSNPNNISERIIERGSGSGAFIGSNHVLTAGHVVYRYSIPVENRRKADARVTTVEAQDRLITRSILSPGLGTNIDKIDFPLDYNIRKQFDRDIALLHSNVTKEENIINYIPPNKVFGLIAFVDPKDALNPDIKIETAGYPADNITNKIKNRLNDDPNRRGRELVRSPDAGDPSATISEITNDILFTTSTELIGRGGPALSRCLILG